MSLNIESTIPINLLIILLNYLIHITTTRMSKASLKLHQLPQPLMLSRKNINSTQVEVQKPYRLGSEQTQTNKPGGLSDMKQELSLIKDGVQKLLTSNQDESNPLIISSVPEVLNKTLKDELAQHKHMEERLKKQLQKTKSEYITSIEQARQAFERRLESVRRDHKEQKSNLKGKIQKYEQAIELLKQNIETKDQQIQELNRVIDQNNNDREVSVKLAESKYDSALAEFKKLEQRFMQCQKGDLATVQHRLNEIQKQNSTLRVQNLSLNNDKIYYVGKFDRLTLQMKELKQRNIQLEDRVRIQVRNIQYVKIVEELKASLSQSQNQKVFLTQTLNQKINQYNSLSKQLSDMSNTIIQNQQLHMQRLEIVNLEVDVNQLKEKNSLLINQIDYLRQVLQEKQSYIQALEDQTYISKTSQAIKQLQQRCQSLADEKNKIVRQYQKAITSLQNNGKSVLFNNSQILTSGINTARSNNFDEALKKQIMQCDILKQTLKQKSDETLSLKLLVEELERRMQTMKSQFQSQKIKLINQQKNSSRSLQYNYQVARQDLQLSKRKEETTQKKLQMKVDQLKKKDEFIQKHLIGKIGRNENQPQNKYLAEQLQKFMNLRLQQSSIIFEPPFKLDTPRNYKHPQFLKNNSLASSMLKQ